MTDPFLQQKAKREALEKLIPKCEFRWAIKRPVSEIHICARITGHRSNHVCACGATRRTK